MGNVSAGRVTLVKECQKNEKNVKFTNCILGTVRNNNKDR